MRTGIEARLNAIWYENQPAPWWLRALVPLYKAGNRLDRWWKLKHQPEDLKSVFIIVVGNITAGGSGKTPLVIRLCQILRQAGFRPGVISRGYGRQDSSLRLVSPASDPGKVGDEPLLIAQRAGVPVIVANDRCEAARKLLQQDINVIISDDGLQHYRLPRSLEICVIDGSRGFGNGSLIPAGPLREPLNRLRSFDQIIVNGEQASLPDDLPFISMTFVAGLLRSLESGQSWRLAQFGGCKANAVAGVGNPARFFNLLNQARIKTIEHVFPDHHIFSAADFEKMDPALPILMTEKDAVKCKNLGLSNAWFLSVDAVLPRDWEINLLQQATREVRREQVSS
ncbi:MAG: tetraacyldisaccharide 4'-kinase [Xanthomonadales bacterium]|jgi:tetraacyldisaccharide 4'-kinase|nr:tetraacyldisaccharide 4'-kinase [Xanthomonadales bacterium]MDH4000139.1 tetraacyldisaccharide 4'-kinase [Xanthomonadales bacterium]